ncbi:MAG TPA: YybS family protein [Candidatus Wallbacteria bacterium]|nr:YybS family protein [Candidatus Wallbacteria bacterium]
MQFQSGAMSRVNGLNKTTLGALFAAILVVLFLISRYLPVIGTISMFFCPVPLVLIQVKFGDIKNTALVALVATALVSVLTGSPFAAFFFLIGVGLQGLVLAYAIGAKQTALRAIFICAMATMASTLVLITAVAPMMELNISVKKQLEVMSESFKKAGEANVESLKKSGASAEQIKNMEQFYVQAAEAVRGMYIYTPLFLLGSALISALINYMAAAMVLRRLNFDVSPVPAFERWGMPWTVLWVFICGLLLINLSGGAQTGGASGYLNLIGLNINAAFLMLFFIDGLAVVHFYLIRYSVNMAARIFLYFLIFFHPLFYMTVLFIGLADPWLDIRKLESENNINEGGLDR